jgi:hypothetical protein
LSFNRQLIVTFQLLRTASTIMKVPSCFLHQGLLAGGKSRDNSSCSTPR